MFIEVRNVRPCKVDESKDKKPPAKMDLVYLNPNHIIRMEIEANLTRMVLTNGDWIETNESAEDIVRKVTKAESTLAVLIAGK